MDKETLRSTFSELQDIDRWAWPAPTSYRGSELQMNWKHPRKPTGITEARANSQSREPDY